MSIQDAQKHFQVSEKTIRRWIKQGKVSAELRDGRYLVSVTGHNDQTVDQTALKKQLRQTNAYLRSELARRDEQIDHLTQLLAMQTKTTAALTERLQASQDMRRWNLWKRLRRRFDERRHNPSVPR